MSTAFERQQSILKQLKEQERMRILFISLPFGVTTDEDADPCVGHLFDELEDEGLIEPAGDSQSFEYFVTTSEGREALIRYVKGER